MVCFVHVPKTGGTTVNFILRQSLGGRFLEPELWTAGSRIVSPADLQACLRWNPWIRHLGGHYVRAYSNLERVLPGARWITFLRDPVKRYLSEYFHVRYKRRRVKSFDEFLDLPGTANRQTQYIAGADDVEAARQILNTKFYFVGLTDVMDESLIMLRKCLADLRLDVRYGRPRNVFQDETAWAEIIADWPNFEPRILENNESDLELYDYARNVIYQRQRAEHGPHLAAEVRTLRRDNVARQGRPWRYYGSRSLCTLTGALYRQFRQPGWPFDARSARHDGDHPGRDYFSEKFADFSHRSLQ